MTRAAEEANARGAEALRAGKPREAAGFLRRAVELSPDEVGYRVNLGLALAAAGDAEGAERAYREALARSPGLAPAHANLGILLRSRGRAAEAETAFRAALAADPGQPQAALGLGGLLLASGRPAEAAERLGAAARAMPRSARARLELGLALRALGRPGEAERAIRESLALDARSAAAWNGLGAALQDQDKVAAAAEAYGRAVDLAPRSAAVHRNLGAALQDLRRPAEAEAALRKGLDLDPDDADAHNNLGVVLRDTGRIAEAEAAFRRAADLAPAHRQAPKNLVALLQAAGRVAEAVATLDAWIAADPGNAVARHTRAALTGEDAPERCDDDYVREAFDAFAATFERRLADLEYRAPALVVEALGRSGASSRGPLDVLDAGCGTGLCAPHLRPWSRRLVGVDLSPGMLARARARGLYDDLLAAELTAHLEGAPAAYDLIVAADVLVYFGALEAVLGAAAGAMRDGGFLAFTVERLEGAGDHRLNAHGRYAHGEDYVRRSLEGAGLGVLSVKPAVLRKEHGAPVHGLVVVAAKG